MKPLGILSVIVILVVVALVVVDVVSAPPPPSTGLCVFQDRILLPNRCLSGCSGCAECPTTKTRPYFFFWTEAAGCPDACICPR